MLDVVTRHTLPWIGVAPGVPYFMDENGRPFTPIGQNDSIAWVELAPLFRRRDLAAVDRHLAWLASSGVTVLRLMMECAQSRHRYIERPMGTFVPSMVQLWDDLFEMCARHGLRILLTPYDTFWMWFRWGSHPYSKHPGHGETPMRMLVCPDIRRAIKERLSFAVRRWGGSGALFAWDLWNEIHYKFSGETVDGWRELISDLSQHVRSLELQLYGRSHPQTVSLFAPELSWMPHLDMREPIFRHPALDFASIHVYQEGPIDDPQDTVGAAIDMGRLVRLSLAEIDDHRPFFDSEHGPIHSFKDKHITLPEPFDDEYFRHMQWAHLASGGAGGGMRWPNRHPHCLTRGMREAQRNLSQFCDLVDWSTFRRRNCNDEIKIASPGLAGFACADAAQAVAWLVRTDSIGRDGRLDETAAPVAARVELPGLDPGAYTVETWNTKTGHVTTSEAACEAGVLLVETPPFVADIALAIRARPR